MDIKEQLKDIKTQLRLSMNGAVSQSMREKEIGRAHVWIQSPS